MATVNLKVTQPDDPTIRGISVYESANPTGPFGLVTTESISAGETVSSLDVLDVASVDDWFAVQWVDDSMVPVTPLSPPFKSSEDSFVEVIVGRVLQRDLSIDEQVARQEAEATIEQFFGKNPYGVTMADIPEGKQYRTINGLTYLTMARCYLVKASSTKNVQSATLGLVSFRSETGTNQQVDVQALIDLANNELGISTSIILQLEDICRERRWENVLEP